ncbi:MAG: endonuclease III domain-containing protein [Candidatus Atribacteria bacterium]|nr:endonuclease III domain-containing protein [Candidatus Atribacteria bacterium]
MEEQKISERLLSMHRCLSDFYGPLHWWPGDTSLEIILGAFLTQNTNWANAEKAIQKIKKEKLLSVETLFHLSEEQLSLLIKSCGYYHLKARRIKNFLFFLSEKYSGSLEDMFNQDWQILRKELLNINGIGPETADSILLYAGNKPVFVVDAYTKRIFFDRHGYFLSEYNYEQMQKFFMKNLPDDYLIYNEFHAQIVMIGKNYCKRKNPDCFNCPLSKFL